MDVLGKVAEAVLGGLTYLYTSHRIMHRDLRPSKVLVDRYGRIKLCDFGASTHLDSSFASSAVGSTSYMSPERIRSLPYTVKSDVWSFGLTLLELATGRYPYGIQADSSSSSAQALIKIVDQIVYQPAPKLPNSNAFPRSLHGLIDDCLSKNPRERPSPQLLYVRLQ